MSPLSILAAAACIFSLNFNDGSVKGVQGNATLFDGINSRIVIPASELVNPEKSFTIDVWLCPVAFPKSPCPIVCRQSERLPEGFNLYIDALGKPHFEVGACGEWIRADSELSLPLRRWSRLTCTFQSGKAIRLALNGKQVASTPMELPTLDAGTFDLWIGRTPVRTPSYFENQSIPIYSSFDGAMDELGIHEGDALYKEVLSTKFNEPEAPQLERRRLPSGPEETLAFGSWYIPLKYYKEWDEQWRGESPDIVVGFGEERPFRVVFWRGISYAPCFVTEKGNWMCNEFIERSKVTGWGCPESMSDKHADFSSIKILENSEARTVVLWRNSPVGVNQKFPYQSEETQWGDWSEETYIFYPDGTGVRKMDLWSSNLDDWSEWCQSLQVLHPDQRPEDVLDSTRIMSVAAMDGRSETFGWNFDCKATQHEASIPGANIQVSYIASKWNPFLILDDRAGLNDHGNDGPEISRYAGHWSEYSAFPWRNHWPVAQDYVIGRYAAVADAPSHTYTATQYCAPYRKENGKMTKLMLCGCTDKDAGELVPLAKSWLRAPEIICGGQAVPYDLTQRAYVLGGGSAGGGSFFGSEVLGGGAIELQIKASTEQPARGLCIIIPGRKDRFSSAKVQGKTLDANVFKQGQILSYKGSSLVLWLDINLDKPASIELN